jgi:hypothetical protein
MGGLGTNEGDLRVLLQIMPNGGLGTNEGELRVLLQIMC